MSAGLVKRGAVWHFDFFYAKQRHQGSTHLRNHEKAKLFLNAYRTNLALTGVGLIQKEPAPTLAAFLKGPFLDKQKQDIKKPTTLRFYTERVRCLCTHEPFSTLTLDKLTELSIQAYKDARLHKKMAIASINAELRVLRKALIFAKRCKLMDDVKVRSLPGEHQRDFVLTGEMEKQYLALAPYPLKQAAILMLDLGLRPEECVSLRKDDIAAAVTVRHGKTPNARRQLPQTERTREVFKLCFAVHPDSPWVFPGLKGGHYTRTALGNLHVKLRRTFNEAAALNVVKTSLLAAPSMSRVQTAKTKWPDDFVLHALRHTFATRLSESTNGDVFVLMKALGHASPKMCAKYIHTSRDYLSLAMKQFELYGRMLRGEVSHNQDASEVPRS